MANTFLRLGERVITKENYYIHTSDFPLETQLATFVGSKFNASLWKKEGNIRFLSTNTAWINDSDKIFR